MQVGVAYPTTEVAGDPDAIRKFVRAADELGYSHLMAFDRRGHASDRCGLSGRAPARSGRE